MARRNPPAKWVLPDVINPPDHLCITIPVPNDRKHIGAFYGAIFNLTSARFWQDDLAHTAKEVAAVWRKIFDDLAPGACDFTVPDIIDEMEYQMSICEQLRFQDGKLQGLCCGEWVDIDGQGSIPPGGGDQPGSGTDQPGSGDCVTYRAQFAANSKWYLPTVVNTGDTIEMKNVKGTGNDGTVSPWRCPDGDTFFAGGCISGTGGPTGGDPLAVKHMRLIASIDGTFYDVLGSVFAVPGGVVNGEVFFQVNDSALADNAGSYNFDVEVCNNSLPDWCHYFDFRLNTYGFTVFVPGGQLSGSSGLWLAGTGFISQDSEQGTPGDWFRRVYIELNGITPMHVVRMDMLGDLTKGVYDNPADDAAALFANVSGTYTPYVELISTSVVTGNGQVWTGSVDTANVTGLLAGLTTGETNPGNTLTGSAVIAGLRVYGKGPNPFGTSNC